MKLVLLPGLDGTGLLFKPLLEVLPINVDALVISYPENVKQNYEDLIDDVTSQLPQEDFILVGESFSSNVAYQIALRNPQNLKAVIFVAGFLSNPRPLLLNFINLFPAKLLFSVSPPNIIIKLFMLDFSAKQPVTQLFKDALKQVSADVISFRLKEIGKLPISHESCKIKAIYIQATHDNLVPHKSVEIFKRMFSDLSIIKVEGPHFILQRNPEACANILIDGLKACS